MTAFAKSVLACASSQVWSLKLAKHAMQANPKPAVKEIVFQPWEFTLHEHGVLADGDCLLHGVFGEETKKVYGKYKSDKDGNYDAVYLEDVGKKREELSRKIQDALFERMDDIRALRMVSSEKEFPPLSNVEDFYPSIMDYLIDVENFFGVLEKPNEYLSPLHAAAIALAAKKNVTVLPYISDSNWRAVEYKFGGDEAEMIYIGLVGTRDQKIPSKEYYGPKIPSKEYYGPKNHWVRLQKSAAFAHEPSAVSASGKKPLLLKKKADKIKQEKPVPYGDQQEKPADDLYQEVMANMSKLWKQLQDAVKKSNEYKADWEQLQLQRESLISETTDQKEDVEKEIKKLEGKEDENSQIMRESLKSHKEWLSNRIAETEEQCAVYLQTVKDFEKRINTCDEEYRQSEKLLDMIDKATKNID